MRNLALARIAVALLAVGSLAAAALACGTPPPNDPPPPPPDPPIVCCVVIDKQPDPSDPGFECWIVRYFRQDGRPLYVSNPMPLPPTQRCVCAVPPLPPEAVAAGASVMGLSFGGQPPWRGLPPNQPGYGPFQPVPLGAPIYGQASEFFNAYRLAAGPTVTPPPGGFAQLWSFGGPGQILPGLVFDIYQKLRVPSGFPPSLLCVPGQMWMIGLFLQDGTTLFAEPISTGLAPIPLPQFQQNPGNSAFYKFKWYPDIVPPVCPPCPGDTDSDFDVDFGDLNIVLSFFGVICPMPPDEPAQPVEPAAAAIQD